MKTRLHDRRRPGGSCGDERGVTFPSPVVVVTIIAIAMAALAFVVTGDSDDDGAGTMQTVSDPAPSGTASTAPADTASAAPSAASTKAPEPEVDRAGVFVEVYNNSGINGLAGTVADTARGAGWNVVGVDDWHGSIPESTVYYPDRLKAEAEVLADDLGLARTYPAVEPMRFDRLTVILTTAP